MDLQRLINKMFPSTNVSSLILLMVGESKRHGTFLCSLCIDGLVAKESEEGNQKLLKRKKTAL